MSKRIILILVCYMAAAFCGNIYAKNVKIYQLEVDFNQLTEFLQTNQTVNNLINGEDCVIKWVTHNDRVANLDIYVGEEPINQSSVKPLIFYGDKKWMSGTNSSFTDESHNLETLNSHLQNTYSVVLVPKIENNDKYHISFGEIDKFKFVQLRIHNNIYSYSGSRCYFTNGN